MYSFSSSSCLACGKSDLIPVISLPATPLTDKYLDNPIEALCLSRFPLDVYLCTDCSHLQLGYLVDPRDSYSTYLYHSSLTVGLSKSFSDYVLKIIERCNDTDPIELLDVGSNDGSFLNACYQNNIKAYGVEPSSALSDMCNNSLLPTANTFFDVNIKETLKQHEFPAKYDLITFNNVFANLPDPLSALLVSAELLKNEKSEIIIQTGYHPVQFSHGLFDYIYHEHFSYFTIKSMQALAERANLQLNQYDLIPLRGGTARFYLGKNTCSNTTSLRERFSYPEDFCALNVLVSSSSAHLRNMLIHYKSNGYQINAFGASHSTGTLMYAFGLIPFIDNVYDDNLYKHNKFVPGTSLKVMPFDYSNEIPSVIVILAWQYFDVIYGKLRSKGFEGPIIKPVIP